MNIILKPVRVAASKPALQTYLNMILFLTTSTILLGLAVFAYILFYFNYVPQISIERVIHLQYGDGPHPYGIASLGSLIISQQAYDISLSLSLPRSPPNLAAGNFMLSLSLLSPTYKPPVASSAPTVPFQPGTSSLVATEDIIFLSRRPAILTYTSTLVSYSEHLVALPLYILGFRRESETLSIPMAESATFPKGRKNVPSYVLLELQAGQDLQVYDVRINFIARFGGLRWLMYNHRIISFFVFTTAFWFSEVLFTVLGWLIFRLFHAPSPNPKAETNKGEETDGSTVIKQEGEDTDKPDLSDTPRTFPTYGRQAPLRYVPKVMDEGDNEEYIIDEAAIQPLTAEADDKEEDGVDFEGFRNGRSDSGLGTSFSEGSANSGLARRRSRGKGGS